MSGFGGGWFGRWLGEWLGPSGESVAGTAEVVGLKAQLTLRSVTATGVSIGRRVGPGRSRAYPPRILPWGPRSVALRDTVLLASRKADEADRKQRARGRVFDWRRMP